MRLYIQLTQLLESVPLYIRYKEEKHLENIFLKTNPENLAISASIMHCVMTSIQRVYSLTYNFSKLNKETEKTNGSLILKADASKQRTLSDKGILFVFVFDFVIFVTLINL